MARAAALLYGVACYAVFFLTFLYTAGFLSNRVVPKSIDSGVPGPVGTALAIDVALLVLFGLQHSVMARPGFKVWWTRFVPRPIERSTYVLASSLALIALFALWQPISLPIFRTEGWFASLLTAGFIAGVGLVLVSTVLIDHFDLFGLRQVVLHFRGQPYREKHFTTPFLYRWIRHPLYVGWFLTFWITPTMSAGHLLFALVSTVYILIAVPLEERDLAHALGEPYRHWRVRTPRFVPRIGGVAVKPPRSVAEPN